MAFTPDENQEETSAVKTSGKFTPDTQQATVLSQEVQERNKAIETAPVLGRAGIRKLMPETSMGGKILAATMGMTTFDPYEFGQILTSINPNIAIQGRPDGTVFATNRETGAIVKINEPGLNVIDALQFLGAVTAATPAGRLKTAGQRIIGESLIQGAIESGQAMSGGEFNPSEVAVAGAGSMVGEYAPELIRSVRQTRRGRALQQAGQEAPQMLAREAAEAAEGSQTPIRTLVQEADVDPALVEAAKTVGLYEEVPISALSRNQRFQALEQSIANMPGTLIAEQQKQALDKLATNTDDLITRLGGMTDRFAYNEQMKDNVYSTISNLQQESDKLYNEIGKLVPKRTMVRVSGIRGQLIERIGDLMDLSNLTPSEKELYRVLKDKSEITYDLLDTQRKRIGYKIGLAKKGQLSTNEDPIELGNLYEMLTDAQGTILDSVSPDAKSLWDTAKGLVVQRKGLQEQASFMFGKEAADNAINKLSTGVVNVQSGTMKQLRQTMEAIPEEFRAGAIASALQGAFAGRAQGQTSMAGFATWYRNANRNRAALEELYSYLPPDASEFIDNLGKLSVNWSEATRQAKPTGQILSVFQNFDKETGWIGRLLGASITGRVARGAMDLVTEAPEESLKATNNLLTSPQFKRIAERAVKGQSVDRLIDRLKLTNVYDAWYNQLPDRSKKMILALGLNNYLFNPSAQDGSESER